MPRPVDTVAICMVVVGALACGDEVTQEARAQAFDSAGVRIVVSDPEARGIARRVLGEEPELVLGALDGPPELLLDDVRAAVRLETA